MRVWVYRFMGLDVNVCIYTPAYTSKPGFPGGSVVKSLLAMQHTQFKPWVGNMPWRTAWQPTPAFLLGILAWTEEPGGLSVRGVAKSWA